MAEKDERLFGTIPMKGIPVNAKPLFKKRTKTLPTDEMVEDFVKAAKEFQKREEELDKYYRR